MSQKWKIILGNWINCYFEEDNKKDIPIKQESVLNIISHLRENYNLDESKSSLLNAHTIHEFILEKYPGFRFKNGTVEPINEEETYMAASLLLFFVCVNSKDVDIKSAMCKKLSADDQKTILKFTKCLMECSNISYTDVLTAISEACGQDIAAAEGFNVPETPPVLRTLHSEVRRLQAALDSERFDRYYLQEELTRNNLKMEKLLKDKEQYKQEIANLKAKTTCCDQGNEMINETANSDSGKLLKQLEQIEERLVSVQEQLDDVQCERDMYKNKLDELKGERDKWLAISEQESTRASQLFEELETERRHVNSLQELLTELRQHNRLNALETSQLECDDLETSIHSILHNASICSEACANVIEVQLSEERAKTVLLKQQMQILQDQLNDLTKKFDEETRNLTQIISDKDTDISNLKHLINEQIEEKNTMKAYYDNEVTKLNNEVNELEQRLCDNGQNSRRIIDSKMKEIQILQEEKLSLLQSLSDEINKFEHTIKGLKTDVDSEKTSKFKMREDYERQMMKLNEKVSNRSNEIVELQNKIFEKGELIEQLQCELRKEKDISGEWSHKYNNDVTNLKTQLQAYETDLRKKTDEVSELKNQIQQNVTYIDALNKDLQYVRSCIAKCNAEYNILEECNNKLNIELKNRDAKIDKIQNDLKNQEIMSNEEKKMLEYNLDEVNATVDTLQNQLQNEIEYKLRIQSELTEANESNVKLKEQISKLNTELSKMKLDITNSDKILVKEREVTTKLKQDLAELNKNYEVVCGKIVEKETIMQLKDSHFVEECGKKDEIINSINEKLYSEIAEKDELKIKYEELKEIKEDLVKNINEKNNVVLELQAEVDRLSEIVKDNDITIKKLEEEVANKKVTLVNLQSDFDVETTKFVTKLNELENNFEQFRLHTTDIVQNKESQMEKIVKENNEKERDLCELLQIKHEKMLVMEKEKSALVQQLEEINEYKGKLEREYLDKCDTLNCVTTQLNDDIQKRKEEINTWKNENIILSKDIKVKIEEINTLESNLENTIYLCNEKETEIKDLQLKIRDMTTSLKDYQKELKQVNDNNSQVVEMLKNENIQLHYTIEEDKTAHELLIKEKHKMIEALGNKLRDKAANVKYLTKDFDNEKNIWEKQKVEMEEQININNDQILDLTNKMQNIQVKLEERELLTIKLEDEIKSITNEKSKLTNELDSLRKTYNESAHSNDTLKENLIMEKAVRDSLESEKCNLLKDKDILIRKLENIEDNYKTLTCERDRLLNEKAILVQELMEEKSILKIADERKDVLLKDIKNIEKKLKEYAEINCVLEQEKECLAQQLVDERLSKDLAEKEKEDMRELKAKLEEKLNAEIIFRTEIEEKNHKLTGEIDILTKNNEDEKCKNMNMDKDIADLKRIINTLHEEINNLSINNKCLKNELLDTEYTQEVLNKEIIKLSEEKAKITELLNNVKIDLKEVEVENMNLKDKVREVSENLSTEIIKHQEEFKNLSVDFNTLKTDYKTLEDNNVKVTYKLKCGLNKFIESIKRDEICMPILQTYECGIENRNVDENCNLIFKIINDLSSELILKRNLEKALEDEDLVIKDLSEKIKEKDIQVSQLEADLKRLHNIVDDFKTEMGKQKQAYTTLLDTKTKEIQHLQHEKDSLNHELNDLKVQLDVKVHSLKDKLIDNESLTDKLKEMYECQIDNLNMMISKLSNYLKEKTTELDSLRNEKGKLHNTIEENNIAIKSLEDEVKIQKQNQEKLINDFESERVILKNMISVTETVMEDQKVNLNNIIEEHNKINQNLQNEVKILKEIYSTEKTNAEMKLKEKDAEIENLNKNFADLIEEKIDLEAQKELIASEVLKLEKNMVEKDQEISRLLSENKEFAEKFKVYDENVVLLEKKNDELKIKNDTNEVEFGDKLKKLQDDLNEQNKHTSSLTKENTVLEEKLHNLEEQVMILEEDKKCIENDKNDCQIKIAELNKTLYSVIEENNVLKEMKNEHMQLLKLADEKDLDIAKLEKRLEFELAQQNETNAKEKLNLINKCAILEEFQNKAEVELENRRKEINTLQEELKAFTIKSEQHISEKDKLITEVIEEKNSIINELNNAKYTIDNLKKDLNMKQAEILTLRNELEEKIKEKDIISILQRENEELVKAVGQRETFALISQDRASPKYSGQDHLKQQVDNTSTDTHSSMESYKTITDLEKIVQDKNRTITTLQSDITFLKTLIAESENKLLDVSKDLEISKENCLQLSSQLKKIVHQKNEEIAELKKQVTKMSATENRASQIIKVSAKYQAIILKRIAEIKSNTVLKELTNFGNSNCDSDIRRSLTAGTITMEDLENFLETTERHIRRCSDKQIVLQKERDRLSEINRINESEIINMRKFLSELSVSMKTFNSIKELYTQKLSRVVSLQRTVRREILSLDGHITDAAMFKLERSYAAVMQDLSECAMNLERWIERCISRAISPEKIKQAFTSDSERVSLAPGSFQNAGLDVQIEELHKSFEKLLEDVTKAPKHDAKDPGDITIMEVRAEYEDKLNRMKAQMKQIYKEQISGFKEKQKKDIAGLESELERMREKMREYESHIKSLTTELWNVGEKFLMKKDENEWLRRKQRSDSLMSLQHVHSSGLVPPPEQPSRPSDAHSLRSLPVTNNNKKGGRTLHMSDEEGEVFDNRWLKEISTPRREREVPPGHRLSELRWRNSLCPPHLKSSYPAETQFAPALQEEDIKCNMSVGGRQQRKEVGITAYKKPGPPTPSKQAGRLSATDSELRESLRVEADPSASRKTSTPSRIRSLFRSNKNDTAESTPRSRRLSNIFNRKK